MEKYYRAGLDGRAGMDDNARMEARRWEVCFFSPSTSDDWVWNMGTKQYLHTSKTYLKKDIEHIKKNSKLYVNVDHESSLRAIFIFLDLHTVGII